MIQKYKMKEQQKKQEKMKQLADELEGLKLEVQQIE